MTNIILPGAACTTMAEVRAGVDQVDRELIALIARRFAYMDAAARIKPERGQVRDEVRKAQVIDNARAGARAAGIPAAPERKSVVSGKRVSVRVDSGGLRLMNKKNISHSHQS